MRCGMKSNSNNPAYGRSRFIIQREGARFAGSCGKPAIHVVQIGSPNPECANVLRISGDQVPAVGVDEQFLFVDTVQELVVVVLALAAPDDLAAVPLRAPDDRHCDTVRGSSGFSFM